MSLASVLLPEPEEPTMPTTWPGSTLKRHVVQHLGTVDAVAEGDVLEGDLAADRRQRGAAGIEARLRHGVEDVAEPIDRQAGLMEVLPHLRQAQHRRAHATGQHVEGDELADGQVAVDHELGAEVEHRGDDQLVDQLHRLARRVVQADDAEARGHIAGELLLPAALHLRLDRHRLQRLDAGDALDQEGLVLRAATELLVEPPAKQRRRASGDRDVERKGRQHDERQQRRIIEHHRQEDEGEEQIDARASAPSSSGTGGCSRARARARPNRRRVAPGNRRSAAPSGGETAGRRARRRCGSSCARTDRCAACRGWPRTG